MSNRDKLLTCALRLFAERGYDAVGVRDIVLDSELTKPTLYHYFGNKQGLLEALLNAYFQPFFTTLKTAADYQGDLPLALYRIVAAYFQFANDHPLFYRMQQSMMYAPSDSLAAKVMYQFNQQQHQILEQLFTLAAKNHGNMQCRQQIYAATLLGIVHTSIGFTFVHPDKALNDEFVYQVVHQFMHGIYS